MRNAEEEHRAESAWYACVREAKPFREVEQLPTELRIPAWFPAFLLTATISGFLLEFVTTQLNLPGRLAYSVLVASLVLYASVSLLDFVEHFRLEKHVTGRYFSYRVVPPGESLVHIGVVATLVGLFALARPLSLSLAPRDWVFLGLPLVFLILGWSDELIYHRRRAVHREDILHTVSHLAAAFMIASLFIARLVDWGQLAAY